MSRMAMTHIHPTLQGDTSSTRLFVTIQGTVGGLAAIVHGIYEIMQGNTPTGGSLLSAIGAFTLIHNYLMTGITVVCVGLALIVWTVGFIQKKYGATVFLLICVALFLVGGGFAQVAFFIIAWGVATQLNRPLDRWSGVLSTVLSQRLARSWPLILVLGYLFLGIGIGIWFFLTPPGTIYTGLDAVHLICWSSLVVGFILQLLTIFSGFARDFMRQGGYDLTI